MGKYSKYVPVCLAAIAPALAAGTASPSAALACSVTVLITGFSAVLAVRGFKNTEQKLLPPFASIMISAAVALGCELIICAAFPSTFRDAPTFPLTGAALFYAACFSSSSAGAPILQNICHVSASALLVLLLGILRPFLSLLPLSGDISAGLLLAGIITAVIQIFFRDRKETLWESQSF